MSSLSRSASPQPARPPAIRSASYPSASPVAPTGLRKKFIDSAIAAPRRDGIPRIPRRKLEVPSTIDSNVNAAVTLPGPDIQWNPSFKTYQERVMKLAAERAEQGREDLGGLPTGFPEKVDAKWCWTGEDFCGDEYVVQLDEKDVDAIENGWRTSNVGLCIMFDSRMTSTVRLIILREPWRRTRSSHKIHFPPPKSFGEQIT